MNVISLPLAELTPDPHNARLHGEDNLAAIIGSLQAFGQVEPLVVLKGTRRIIGGNGRFEAMRAMGWESASVVEVELGGPEATALGLALNRTAELATWDPGVLHELVDSLQATEFDLDTIGFNPAQIAQVFADNDPEDEAVEEDHAPNDPPKNPVTQLGDLWLLGDHRLLCGDSTSKEAVDRLMAGKRAVIMNTDPPYGVSYDATWRGEAGANPFGANRTGKVSADDRSDWTEVYALAPADIVYIWHASAFSDIVMASLRNAGIEIRQQIIWHKTIMILSRSAYHWKHEPCWYGVRKGKTAQWVGDRKQTTVWTIPPPNHMMSGSKDDRTPHPTQKPIELFAIPIRNHTNHGDIVYEPFSGSGSQYIAAEQLGRRCYGLEVDPAYCDVIVERFEKLTGKKAVRG